MAYARAQLGPLNTELGTGDLRIRAAITVSLRVWWLERDHGPAEQVGLVHVGDRPMQTVCEQGFPARDFLPQIILGRGKRAGDDCAQLRKRMTAVIGEAPRQASSAAGAEGAGLPSLCRHHEPRAWPPVQRWPSHRTDMPAGSFRVRGCTASNFN